MRWWSLPALDGHITLHLFAPWMTALYRLTMMYFPK